MKSPENESRLGIKVFYQQLHSGKNLLGGSKLRVSIETKRYTILNGVKGSRMDKIFNNVCCTKAGAKVTTTKNVLSKIVRLVSLNKTTLLI